MIRRPPRSTQSRSSAASDVYKRQDPSHLVTLEKNQPVQYGNYEYTLIDTVVVAQGDEDFDFQVGDGFLGVIVEMRKDGELVDTLTPGILRFGPVPRSEVDRHVG